MTADQRAYDAITFDFGNTLLPVDRAGLRAVVEVTGRRIVERLGPFPLEAFLTVWRTAGRFIPERAKASTWILTLVHRRAVDLVRREQRRRRPAPVEDPAAPTPAADEEATLRDRRRAVQAALQQLPTDQREAIELAYYGGLTQAELADRNSWFYRR